MLDSKWEQTIADLKRDLARIESSSRGVALRLEILQREAEPLKIEFLKYSLEEGRKAVARQRGLSSIIRDRDTEKMGMSAAVAAVASIIGGLASKDKWVALNDGWVGLNSALEGFGETTWAVSLDKGLSMAPYDAIPAKGTWVTLESLIAAIDKFKMEAVRGKRVGTYGNIIQRLQQSKELIYVGRIIRIQPVAVRVVR
jgi:hypothetical protein